MPRRTRPAAEGRSSSRWCKEPASTIVRRRSRRTGCEPGEAVWVWLVANRRSESRTICGSAKMVAAGGPWGTREKERLSRVLARFPKAS